MFVPYEEQTGREIDGKRGPGPFRSSLFPGLTIKFRQLVQGKRTFRVPPRGVAFSSSFHFAWRRSTNAERIVDGLWQHRDVSRVTAFRVFIRYQAIFITRPIAARDSPPIISI